MATTITYRTKRWRRVEYDRMIENGVFTPDDRLELLAGELVVQEPQGGSHALAVELAQEALRDAFGRGWRVRVQLPIALDEESEPEPDVSVVAGTARQAPTEHPSHPVLIVEVAESSLTLDRKRKASLYARAQVPEYWIVNLLDRGIEVHREPAASPDATFGWGYGHVQNLRAEDTVIPLAAPHARIAVADLLP